jgi:ABC-type multidrug transport system ATPase subunit
VRISLRVDRLAVGSDDLIIGYQEVFEDINCLVVDGENGVGKSSLLKGIMGFKQLHFRGELGLSNASHTLRNSKAHSEFAYLGQSPIRLQGVTVREFLGTSLLSRGGLLGYSHYPSLNNDCLRRLETTFADILQRVGVDFDNYLDRLNYSNLRLLQLLRLPLDRKEVVLLDEPFEHLKNAGLESAREYVEGLLVDRCLIVLVDHTKFYKGIPSLKWKCANLSWRGL